MGSSAHVQMTTIVITSLNLFKQLYSSLLNASSFLCSLIFLNNGVLSQVQVLGIWWLRTSGGGQPKKSETDQNRLPVNRFQKGSFPGSKCSKRERQESGDNLGIGESAEICLSTFLALNRLCQTLDERPGRVARWASTVLNAVKHVEQHRPFGSSKQSLEATVRLLLPCLGFPGGASGKEPACHASLALRW